MEESGRNRWQPVANRAAVRTAQTTKTVAVGCDQLPPKLHGKEGVDGSSPSEGSAKEPHIGTVLLRSTCSRPKAVGMEPFMELSDQRRGRAPALKCRAFADLSMTDSSRCARRFSASWSAEWPARGGRQDTTRARIRCGRPTAMSLAVVSSLYPQTR
jgi:hypothetical protein